MRRYSRSLPIRFPPTTTSSCKACERHDLGRLPRHGGLQRPENVVAEDGTLRLQSKGTVWDGGRPLGAFLFKLVTGDFVAEVTVADYAGLSTRRVPGNNDGGLMVRVPKVDDAGPGEDLVQLNFFPIWNQGNMVTNLDSGRAPRKATCWHGTRIATCRSSGRARCFISARAPMAARGRTARLSGRAPGYAGWSHAGRALPRQLRARQRLCGFLGLPSHRAARRGTRSEPRGRQLS